MNLKGVSNVVSAVLLITMVVALASAFGYVYMNLLYTYEDSAQNNFFEEIGVPSGCSPNYSPGDWSGCEISYNLNTLVNEEVMLYGKKERILVDVNGCAKNKKEKELCSAKEKVSASLTGNIFVIKNSEGLIVSEIEVIEGEMDVRFYI